jgi:hypothetical protein
MAYAGAFTLVTSPPLRALRVNGMLSGGNPVGHRVV